MKPLQAKEIYQNRAELRTDCPPISDHTDCAYCTEELVFAMRDKEHTFSLGLSLVLHCLAIAEKDGYVPKLPEGWWSSIRMH